MDELEDLQTDQTNMYVFTFLPLWKLRARVGIL